LLFKEEHMAGRPEWGLLLSLKSIFNWDPGSVSVIEKEEDSTTLLKAGN
jgi:hypothetical protein